MTFSPKNLYFFSPACRSQLQRGETLTSMNFTIMNAYFFILLHLWRYGNKPINSLMKNKSVKDKGTGNILKF